MAAPIPEHAFHKLVRDHGFHIQPLGKEWGIFDDQGNLVLSFWVRHKKGGKREVYDRFVKRFLTLVK